MIDRIKELIRAHNEVVFNIYGDSEPRDLSKLKVGLKDRKQLEEIVLNLTSKHLKNNPKEKIDFIIATAMQQDILFMKRHQEINGELVLDNKGLQIVEDGKGGVKSLIREFILRENYHGALSSKISNTKKEAEESNNESQIIKK